MHSCLSGRLRSTSTREKRLLDMCRDTASLGSREGYVRSLERTPNFHLEQATGELHPIAVLNVNYGGSSVSGPNMNVRALDELDDVFTRRFFFFDSVSGCVRFSGVGGSNGDSVAGLRDGVAQPDRMISFRVGASRAAWRGKRHSSSSCASLRRIPFAIPSHFLCRCCWAFAR